MRYCHLVGESMTSMAYAISHGHANIWSGLSNNVVGNVKPSIESEKYHISVRKSHSITGHAENRLDFDNEDEPGGEDGEREYECERDFVCSAYRLRQ